MIAVRFIYIIKLRCNGGETACAPSDHTQWIGPPELNKGTSEIKGRNPRPKIYKTLNKSSSQTQRPCFICGLWEVKSPN